MIVTENECVGCETCIGSFCRKRKIKHYYCDKCKQEDTLYEFDDKQLCIDCIKDMLDEVE